MLAVVQGIEEVLLEWEEEAAEMAKVVMEMEKMHVSSVFFQRVALKRKQRSAYVEPEVGGRLTSAARSLRSSGQGFISKVFRRGSKSGEESEPAAPAGRRPPPRRRGQPAAEEAPAAKPKAAPKAKAPSGPSFAKPGGAPAGGRAPRVFTPPAAKNVAFVQHIPKWGAPPRPSPADTSLRCGAWHDSPALGIPNPCCAFRVRRAAGAALRRGDIPSAQGQALEKGAHKRHPDSGHKVVERAALHLRSLQRGPLLLERAADVRVCQEQR